MNNLRVTRSRSKQYQLAFIQAIAKNDASQVQALLGSVDVNKPTAWPGRDENELLTPIVYAVSNNHVETANLLVNVSNLEETDAKGRTPLILAVRQGNEDLIHALLEAGANVNSSDQKGGTVLMHTAHGKLNCRLGHAAQMVVLNQIMDTTDRAQVTALFESLKPPRDKVVREFLIRDADVNAVDDWGNTALMHATKIGRTGMVKALLEYGADLNATATDGSTCLILAIKTQNFKIFCDLVRHRANLNAVDEDGNSALILSIEAKFQHGVWVLLQHGADPNTVDIHGRTALILAAQSHMELMVRSLLDFGADVNATGPDGRTALIHACKRALPQLSPSQQQTQDFVIGSYLRSPRWIARHPGLTVPLIQHPHVRGVVPLLIAFGSDVNMSDNRGLTALAHASSRGFREHMNLLLAHQTTDVDAPATSGLTGTSSVLNKKKSGRDFISQFCFVFSSDAGFLSRSRGSCEIVVTKWGGRFCQRSFWPHCNPYGGYRRPHRRH